VCVCVCVCVSFPEQQHEHVLYTPSHEKVFTYVPAKALAKFILLFPVFLKRTKRSVLRIPYEHTPLHAIPFHSIPFHSIPFYSILFHSIPFYSILFHSIPLQTPGNDGSKADAKAHRALLYHGWGNGHEEGSRTPSAWLIPGSNRIALRVSTRDAFDAGFNSDASVVAGQWNHLCFTMGFATHEHSDSTSASSPPPTAAGAADADAKLSSQYMYRVRAYINGKQVFPGHTPSISGRSRRFRIQPWLFVLVSSKLIKSSAPEL
jgi:hypothetical protein